MSTALLVLRDQRFFQTFNLTFWFYFVIIITINVEMTGVLLDNTFSASIFQKKKNELGLVTIKNLNKLPF